MNGPEDIPDALRHVAHEPRPLDQADPLNDVLAQILELIAAVSGRVAELDLSASHTVERLATLVAELAANQRVLSDRISMLELDRKGDQG